jgi:hypothetical protein
LSNNGPEWTVKRLKDAKKFYLYKLQEKDPEMDLWWSKTGPSSNRRFRSHWLNLPIDTVPKVLRAIQACNAYTVLVNDGNPTKSQMSKFFTSVENMNPDLSSKREITSFFRALPSRDGNSPIVSLLKSIGYSGNEVPVTRKGRTCSSPSHFSEFSWSSKKKAPMGSLPRTAESELDWVADNLGNMAVMGQLFQYRNLASPSGFSMGYMGKSQVSPYMGPLGGLVSFLQEPGYKLRAIANPYRVHQVVLEPLKKTVMSILEGLKSDCTHNQFAGVDWCQQQLKEGKTLYAVDLSDATNNVPLSSQLLVLDQWLDMHDKTTCDLVSYFCDISRADWLLPDGSTVRWNKGQPLGLGPSFGVFALWHNTLLSALSKVSGLGIQDHFRVVGDDVVISDPVLHERYRQALKELNVPVSESKCMSSDKVTEFVGYIITDSHAFPTVKWKSPSDNNFLDVVKHLGPRGKGLLRSRQRRIVDAVSWIPEPLGGLGWNPRGIPLQTRVELAYESGLLSEETPSEVSYKSLTRARLTALRKLYYKWDLAHPDARYGVSTRDPDFLNVLLVGDKNESLAQRIGGQPLSDNRGDPRGPSRLSQLEVKIEKSQSVSSLRRVVEYHKSKLGTEMLPDPCDSEEEQDTGETCNNWLPRP